MTSLLHALCDRAGILPSYRSADGDLVELGDDARRLLLHALGIDAGSEARVADALADLEEAEAARLLPPTRVLRRDVDSFAIDLRLAPGDAADGDELVWSAELRTEGGDRLRAGGRAFVAGGRLPVALPHALWPGLGYHDLAVAVATPRGERTATQRFIVVPRRCVTAAERLGGRRGFGLCANLYTLRSRRDAGVGDLGDLAALAAWARELGAAFVGVSPLHALSNLGADVSPYSPQSRLYRNPIYLDVDAVPELAGCAAAREHWQDAEAERVALRAADRVDYERVWRQKRRTLAHCHAAARLGRDPARAAAYAAYRAAQGSALDDFALFCAVADHGGEPDHRAWPAALRDRIPATLRHAAEAHAERIDFHAWLQFELDRQLAAAAGGLPLGLYQDLAVGSSPGGADPWSFRDLFVTGAAIGAPPDPLAEMGQDWGLPPIDPRALAADGYRYFALLVRNAMAHSGALRIDHVMGLHRQFWVPAGHRGTDGGYVRYPVADLLGILALESHRQRAIVVGEDLGTVPDGFTALLADWGVLSTEVLYFQRDDDGGFRPARRYSDRALVTATTHDLAPLAGWRDGDDLTLRRELGEIVDDAELGAARAARATAVDALVARLRDEGAWRGEAPPAGPELTGAVHTMLYRTPAPLVGVWADDLAGERVPVNLPGFTLDRYPSWQRKLGRDLEELRGAPDVAAALGAVHERALDVDR